MTRSEKKMQTENANNVIEQPGNLTMLNTHPELINLSNNSIVSDIYKNPVSINKKRC